MRAYYGFSCGHTDFELPVQSSRSYTFGLSTGRTTVVAARLDGSQVRMDIRAIKRSGLNDEENRITSSTLESKQEERSSRQMCISLSHVQLNCCSCRCRHLKLQRLVALYALNSAAIRSAFFLSFSSFSLPAGGSQLFEHRLQLHHFHFFRKPHCILEFPSFSDCVIFELSNTNLISSPVQRKERTWAKPHASPFCLISIRLRL
jgi:hypothetical protein